MKQEQVKANYSMSQGDLLLTCHTKGGFMARDAAAFATRGVAPARFAAFGSQTTACGKLPSDERSTLQNKPSPTPPIPNAPWWKAAWPR